MSFNYPKGVCFQCIRCALCCGDTETRIRHILLLEIEAKQISEAVSKPIKDFAKKVEGYKPYFYEMQKTAKEGKCVFLKGNHCAIYASRPLVCRFYPFELRATKNGSFEFLYTEECQGIGRGQQLKKSYFEGLLQQLPT